MNFRTRMRWGSALVAMTAMLALTACAPREWLLPKVGIEPPALRDFPADFTPPVSSETNLPMPGFGGGGGGVNRTPVIFIHGNTVSARYWLPVRAHFEKAGWTKDELWALGYGWDNVRYFDGNDLSVPSVERIVTSVMDYLSEKAGRPIRQVDLIGHSLGVTLVRQWMKQTNSYHKVRAFIGACGANQGVWTAWPDARGQNRVVSFEVNPGSPWLAQLNRGGEVPGATRYMTLYDGTGHGDTLFPKPYEHSSALKGARNVAFNVEHGTHYGHLDLPRQPDTMEAMVQFLKSLPEPLPEAEPPRLVRAGDTVRAEPTGAQVRCTSDATLPTRETPGAAEVALHDQALYTCYAHDARSELSGPLERFRAVPAVSSTKTEPLTLTATPGAGSYEQPVTVKLEASEPDAVIVYSTSGTPVASGSPLYGEPIYVPGPLTLTAVAYGADGRVTAPLSIKYDISLELINANRSLERQFDPSVPAKYEGKRPAGR